MWRKFWRSKKGQIQGVDFALAMIVFMIMFAQVIVLTLSFTQPKYQNLNDRIFESKAQQIAETFFGSSGSPNYWEYNLTTNFRSFGLKTVGLSSLDPNKLSRTNPYGIYAIDYDDVINSISSKDDFGFQLIIDSFFSVNSTLTISPPAATIIVQTSIGNCVIWNFVVAPNGAVIFTNRTSTNENGFSSETFPINAPLPSGFFTLVTFAQSSPAHFANDIYQLTVGTSSELGLKMIVQEEEANNGRVRVITQNNGSLSTLRATILYPYLLGSEIYGNDSQVIISPTDNELFNLRIPTNGSSVVLLTGETATGEFSRKYFTFPTLLNENFRTLFGQYYLPEKVTLIKIEHSVVIRECLYKAVLYIWSK